MPSTRHRRQRTSPANRRHTHHLAVLAVLAGLGLGLTGCSDDDQPPVGAAATTPAPSKTGAVSDSAAWAAHSPVPAGFTRLASAKLSIGVPDGYEAVNDPQRLGTTDLAATNNEGAVIAARVIPIAEGQIVPEEGPAWAAAGDVAKAAEASKSKDIQIVDADVDDQDGWRVRWIAPKSAGAPELTHVWTLVDIDDSSFAIVSVQGPATAFADGKLDQVADSLVIRGVTDGTAPTATTKN